MREFAFLAREGGQHPRSIKVALMEVVAVIAISTMTRRALCFHRGAMFDRILDDYSSSQSSSTNFSR